MMASSRQSVTYRWFCNRSSARMLLLPGTTCIHTVHTTGSPYRWFCNRSTARMLLLPGTTCIHTVLQAARTGGSATGAQLACCFYHAPLSWFCNRSTIFIHTTGSYPYMWFCNRSTANMLLLPGTTFIILQAATCTRGSVSVRVRQCDGYVLF
jgi:hypothetical protein